MAGEIRDEVRARYALAARDVLEGRACRGDGCGPVGERADFGSARYTAAERDQLPVEAVSASLGCGNPLAVADLAAGETILDLGSGGGIDVLLSARRVGPGGRAYGLDMTDEMLELARGNAARAGAFNVEFLKGAIEDIPLPAGAIDVVISNCVVNLSPDKPAVFRETYRVLRPGGRIGITDVIAADHLTPADRAVRGDEVGCIAGALTAAEYRAGLAAAGFADVEITPTHQVADGMHSAIIRAVRPAGQDGVTIRPMRAGDADQVLAIYQAGLDGGDAGFEITAPAWADFDRTRLPGHRHVAVAGDGSVLGWVAGCAVSDRCVYGGVVEHSIYVRPDARGRGAGAALLDAFIRSTEAAGIWTIQSGVFPENGASLRIHERAGFRVVGVRERIGRHRDRWRDVVFIERRSATVV